MARHLMITASVAAGLLGASAAAEYTYIDTFESGSSVGGWTFGTGFGHIQWAGGNPGAFFRDNGLISFFPRPRTTGESLFTGDYRTAGVLSVGIDLKTFWVEYTAEGRPLSVVLLNHNGTPDDYDDDWAAYFVGEKNIPLVSQGWMSYTFQIPSQATELPEGWDFIRIGMESPQLEDLDWNDAITDVGCLHFFYGDPGMVYLIQCWDVGCDNPRITMTISPCPADVNVDWTVDVLDLLAVIGAWGQSGVPQDVNGDGTVDVLDVLEVIAAWGDCF